MEKLTGKGKYKIKAGNHPYTKLLEGGIDKSSNISVSTISS